MARPGSHLERLQSKIDNKQDLLVLGHTASATFEAAVDYHSTGSLLMIGVAQFVVVGAVFCLDKKGRKIDLPYPMPIAAHSFKGETQRFEPQPSKTWF